MPPRLKIASVAASLAAVAALAWLVPRQPLAAAEAPPPETARPADFALAECRTRLLDGSPAIAVAFTQPLAPGQAWGRIVHAFEGDAPSRDGRGRPTVGEADLQKAKKPVATRWVLGDNPRILYLPFAKPGKVFRIEIGAELKAAGGAALPKAADCSAVSQEMPPSFHFASRGTVLPAGLNGGLPVVTVNTPEVDVQFLRIADAELPAFLEQVAGTRRARPAPDDEEGEAPKAADDPDATDDDGDRWYRYGDDDDGPGRRLQGHVSGWKLDEQLRQRARSVYITRFTTDRRADRRNVSYLPVEQIAQLQKPGVYVAVMTAAGRFAWDYQVTHFYVTDIGLHARRHAAQTDVFATSLRTGEAIRGLPVRMLDERGRPLAEATTDGDGRAVFTAKLDAARVVTARRGSEISLLALREPALDLSEFELGGQPSGRHKLFVWAGRDLYRPGERFTVNVLARDADGRPLPAPAAAASAPGITLTLKQPDGRPVTTRLVPPAPAGVGYYRQTLELPADAPTGRWWLEARTDPASRRADTRWPLQVEEFLPERMKLELAAPAATRVAEQSDLDVAVTGRYLYGAPAAGNRLLASVLAEREAHPLPRAWPDFVFGDVAERARTREDLAERELDAAGRATVRIAMPVADRRSPMRVRASFSLLESNGRPVVRSIERQWWPAPVLVGVRPVFDRDVAREDAPAEFELTRVDTAGRFVAAKRLELRLVREHRHWYWRHAEGGGWHSGYETQDEVVDERALALPRRTILALPVSWGTYRLEVLDPQTGQTLKYRFHAGWGAQDAEALGNRPDRVKIELAGAPYAAGGSAKLRIVPPHDGEALVTVEGDRVLWSRRVAVRAAGTALEIPLDKAWERHDLYVGVVAFRPASRGDRVTPSRAVGLVHLPLSRDARRLKVEIAAPARATPERTTPVKLRVLGTDGQPVANRQAIVTLSAVDTGILAITDFATPDPFDAFFGRQRYQADLLDLYGKLIERMDGNAARLSFGGDTGPHDTRSLPRKLRLVDLFSGPVALDARGEATVPLALPDFNGTLRLMAVAATADRYGSAQAETIVSAPIVAELAMPRFVAPGDVATLALDVTNLSGSTRTVGVAVEAGAPLVVRGQPAPVTLADGQKTVLRFTAAATDATGLAPIRLTVTAGDIRLVREAALQVLPLGPPLRLRRQLRVDPGQSLRLDPVLGASLWPASAAWTLTLSSSPPIDVRDAVQGLLMYPYGCAEQTTSSSYPLVFIDAEAARSFGMTPLSREERAKRLDVAFGRLAGMQSASGGFGLWSPDADADSGWLGAYIAGFLSDAKREGFAVPEPMQAKATTWLLERFQRAPGEQTTPPASPKRDAQGRLLDRGEIEAVALAHQRFADAAHIGYVLALQQKAPLATLRALHERFRGNARSPLPLVHLGLALRLMGDEPRAAQAFDDALQRPYGIGGVGRDGEPGDWLGDYGSRIRDLALSYALLRRHGLADARQENLLVGVDHELPTRQYLSTQERLALFLAARAAAGAAKDPWSARFSGARGDTLTSKAPLPTALDTATLTKGLTLTNTGSRPLFGELSVVGHPKQPPTPYTTAVALSVERSWWTPQGERVTRRDFRTGETLVVRLRVRSNRELSDGLVVDRIPAGFEIENGNLLKGAGSSTNPTIGDQSIADAMAARWIRHVEYREDRFVAALNVGTRAQDLFYVVRVVTPGRYAVPPTFAEAMYRPEIRWIGTSEAGISVVDPKPR